MKARDLVVLTMRYTAALLLTGCAIAPQTLKLEAEHVSHPLIGWPCDDQREDGLSQASVLLHWQNGGAYFEAGVGYNLQGRDGGGIDGPAFMGTVRAGYEIQLRRGPR